MIESQGELSACGAVLSVERLSALADGRLVKVGKSACAARLWAWASQCGFELLMILGILGALAHDRYILCREYLFRYTDEDQTCMWYAAHDLLHGRIAEPAFYGQDYNSCIEGFLAVPLVALHVPYNIACPLVTVLLGLLPFVLLAVVACRREYFLAAAGVLMVPLMMSNRYGMICGIPRGFINGIAVATIPMILVLPKPIHSGSVESRLDELSASSKVCRLANFILAGLRYFLAGAIAVAAMQVNPNCVILLVPVAVYAFLTRFFNWKMWAFTPLGIAAALPYPWYVHQFYHVYHPDYVLYLRDVHFEWGYRFYTDYLRFSMPNHGPSPVFADIVPFFVTGVFAPRFLLAILSALAVLLFIRLHIAAVCALVSGVAILLVSFALNRVSRGEASNTASYPYARMWLAIPVVFAWLVFLLSHGLPTQFAGMNWARWVTRGTLALIFCAAVCCAIVNENNLPKAIDAELHASGLVICPAVPVANLYAIAREIKKVADAQHADLVIVGGGDAQKHVAYAIPALLGIETIFPSFERRTFRLIEESKANHDKILLIFETYYGTPVGGGRLVTLDADGNEINQGKVPNIRGKPRPHAFVLPIITMIDADGRNAYQIPQLQYWMPRLLPLAPGNARAVQQVYRPTWTYR